MLTVLTGMVAHGLLAYAHRTVPLATVGVLQVGQPALSVTWAWLIVDERISIAQVPGMALVIIGQALFVDHQPAPGRAGGRHDTADARPELHTDRRRP